MTNEELSAYLQMIQENQSNETFAELIATYLDLIESLNEYVNHRNDLIAKHNAGEFQKGLAFLIAFTSLILIGSFIGFLFTISMPYLAPLVLAIAFLGLFLGTAFMLWKTAPNVVGDLEQSACELKKTQQAVDRVEAGLAQIVSDTWESYSFFAPSAISYTAPLDPGITGATAPLLV